MPLNQILDPPAAATKSQITVSSLGSVSNVEVTLDITHSFVGDLSVFLVSPSGTQVELFTGVGGPLNDMHLTLSDTAARSITSLVDSDWSLGGYTGTWRPAGSLSDFAGENSAGIWTLVVSDTYPADVGTLDGWTLHFQSGELFTTTDENGYYSFDNLPAGSYIVREEPGAAPWVQVPPAVTAIPAVSATPAATWSNSRWNVTIVPFDDFLDPAGADSHRNVTDVDFGNFAPLGSIQGQVYKDLNGNSTKNSGDDGLPAQTVFIDSDGSGTPVFDDTVSSSTSSAITNTAVVHSKLYFGDLGSVQNVEVTLDISHPDDGELTATLISPSGTRVKLFSGVGAGGQDFQGTVIHDGSGQAFSAGTPPFDSLTQGEFDPEEPLSAFNGQNARGFWTLEIVDSTAGNDGLLNSWSLNVLGDELSTTTDVLGNYTFANLIPSTYAVAAVQQTGWTATEVHPSVPLTAVQNLLNVNLGSSPPTTPGDYSHTRKR